MTYKPSEEDSGGYHIWEAESFELSRCNLSHKYFPELKMRHTDVMHIVMESDKLSPSTGHLRC